MDAAGEDHAAAAARRPRFGSMREALASEATPTAKAGGQRRRASVGNRQEAKRVTPVEADAAGYTVIRRGETAPPTTVTMATKPADNRRRPSRRNSRSDKKPKPETRNELQPEHEAPPAEDWTAEDWNAADSGAVDGSAGSRPPPGLEHARTGAWTAAASGEEADAAWTELKARPAQDTADSWTAGSATWSPTRKNEEEEQSWLGWTPTHG